MRNTIVAVCLLALPATPLLAQQKTPDAVRAAVERIAPDADIDAIEASPVDDLYEVRLGPEVVYVSADGRYLIQGDLVDLAEGVNITEAARKMSRVAALEDIPLENMIVFSPPQGETRYHVSVFTDVDCPYCRKLHREIQDYVEAGIEVRYLAYPRAGEGSKTFETMVSVWCADNARRAITDAKAGRAVKQQECENPVAEQYRLGQRVGVRGTPTIITEDGTVVPGYVSADRLLGYLEAPHS